MNSQGFLTNFLIAQKPFGHKNYDYINKKPKHFVDL